MGCLFSHIFAKKTMTHVIKLLAFALFVSCSSQVEPTATPSEPTPDNPYGWRYAPSIDEFGDTAKVDGSLIGLFPGTFSNSATLKDTLIVKMEVGDSMILGQIYEYGTIPGISDNLEVTPGSVAVKLPDSVRLLPLNFGMGYFASPDRELLNLLTSIKAPVKMRVDMKEVNQYLSTEYVFTVDPLPARLLR